MVEIKEWKDIREWATFEEGDYEEIWIVIELDRDGFWNALGGFDEYEEAEEYCKKANAMDYDVYILNNRGV